MFYHLSLLLILIIRGLNIIELFVFSSGEVSSSIIMENHFGSAQIDTGASDSAMSDCVACAGSVEVANLGTQQHNSETTHKLIDNDTVKNSFNDFNEIIVPFKVRKQKLRIDFIHSI